MSKRREMQRLIRAYKDETGELEVDMHRVADYAVSKEPIVLPMDLTPDIEWRLNAEDDDAA